MSARVIKYPNKKLAFITCCADDWGGSEELWARSIPFLKARGIDDITVVKKRINRDHPEFVSLAKHGVHFRELEPPVTSPVLAVKLGRLRKRVHARLSGKYYTGDGKIDQWCRYLLSGKPRLVVISQGINFDGLVYARQCLRLRIPYVLIAQKAVDFYWPGPAERPFMRACYQQAEKCIFVSNHNRNLTEEQFGIRLSNSSILSNPVRIPAGVITYPPAAPVYKLACVARLFVLDKGQDILLRILARPKWRGRPVEVSFIGSGVDEDGLRAMATLLQLGNVRFPGYIRDIGEVWKEHHALILPSRSEGLPLSILEAMAAGRPAIVSNAGGNAEIVQDEVTGFVGEPGEHSFEQAMERAWKKRSAWADIGRKASEYIRNRLPPDPEISFANDINQILHEK